MNHVSQPVGCFLRQQLAVEVNVVQRLQDLLLLLQLLLQDVAASLLLLFLLVLPQQRQPLLQLGQRHLTQQLIACSLAQTDGSAVPRGSTTPALKSTYLRLVEVVRFDDMQRLDGANFVDDLKLFSELLLLFLEGLAKQLLIFL